MPNSPMRTQIKCEQSQQQQQLPPQSQYPERMLPTTDNRKIMNTQTWMTDHRFINYPQPQQQQQQQQQHQQQYRTGSAVFCYYTNIFL